MDSARFGDEQPIDAPTAVILVEPARQRLITLAADVVGQLAPEDVPASLRAIARFTQAKRRRLGAVALAAALDADGVFRELVADAVAETSPQLTAAVREGAPTTAQDPVDTAVVAYLIRPPGWAAVVAAANVGWAQERGAAAAASKDAARLREELAAQRARERSEPARIREAVAAAVVDLQAELAELRRVVRERTRDLRVAAGERDGARAGQAEARRILDAQTSAYEAQLRRLRSRLSELERAGESTRRGSRTERDVDDARLWLLVDTLMQAASGVRHELSLSAPTVAPADTVSSATGESSTRSADDPLAFDRLLGLPNVHLVVDGYNVTKTGYGELSLEQQRTRLVGGLAAVAGRSGAEITVAFDGGAKPPSQPATPRGVRVLFSAAQETADDLIRRLVAAEPLGRPVIVVTSDREIVTDVARAGGWTASADILLARLG